MGLNIYMVCRLQGKDLTREGREEEGEGGSRRLKENVNLSRKWGLKLPKCVFHAHPVKEEQRQEGETPVQAWGCVPKTCTVPSFLPWEILVYPARLEENVIKL